MVDGCRSKLVNVVSGVPQGSVLGQSLFFLYTPENFFILQNKLIGYANDSTLMVVVPSTGVGVIVAESSVIRDLGRVLTAGGVFECDIAHRLSVAVQCMLYI